MSRPAGAAARGADAASLDAAQATLRTEFCARVGVGLPIVQAPIGRASNPAMVAAVSNAGGLGMLAVTWDGEDDLRSRLRATRALTDCPFGVNLILAWPPERRLAICLEEGARLISFFWGDPGPYLAQVHEAGALAALTVADAASAAHAAEQGVDVLVAQGWEAGGHVYGEVATLPLVPAVVDAAGDVPVLAAGGVADGRGLAAALALGASGVWVGTRFLAAAEASVDETYRTAVLNGVESDTVHSTLFDEGWEDAPHRTLRNSTVRAWEAAQRPPRGRRPGEGETVATLPDGSGVPRYHYRAPADGLGGQPEAMAQYAGQAVGIVRDVRPAGDIVAAMARDAAATIVGLGARGQRP